MKISVPETPVLTQIFKVSGAPVKVKYSIEVMNDDVWHEETTVHVYSVNSAPVTLFTRAVREEIDMSIRDHAANVLKEFDLDKGCGHDQYLSMQME
jgi:hypothetical protein